MKEVHRICTAKEGACEPCECTDAEMQPCMAVVVERLLKNFAEHGPEPDPFFSAFVYEDMNLMMTTYDSEGELLFQFTGDPKWLDLK